MFQRTRRTLSNSRTAGYRHTMRNQRGGEIQSLAMFRFSTSERREKWKGSMPEFKSLFTDTIDIHEYIQCIQKQDELFTLALKHIQETLQISSDTEFIKKFASVTYSPEEKVKNSDIIKGYIGDVLSLITLDNAVRTSITTAWKKDMDDSNLIKLLTTPKRVENIFVQALATVFFIMKDDTATMNLLKGAISNELAYKDLTTQLAEKYSGYANALSYTLTNAPIRGSFFARQEPTGKGTSYPNERTFASIITEGRGISRTPCKGFWCEFIHHCIQDSGIFFGTSDWAVLTANIYNIYTQDPENLLKAVVSSIKHTNKRRDINDKEKTKFSPDNLSTKLFGTETTLEDVLKQISFDAFQFVIHLVYTLEKQRPELEGIQKMEEKVSM